MSEYTRQNGQGIYGAGDTQITEYTWDHRNRLNRATFRDTYGGAVTKTVDYVYDAYNQMIKRTVREEWSRGDALAIGRLALASMQRVRLTGRIGCPTK